MEWIKTSDRVPDNWDDILLYDGFEFCVGFYLKTTNSFNYRTGGEPTHWMPLPESPKE